MITSTKQRFDIRQHDQDVTAKVGWQRKRRGKLPRRRLQPEWLEPRYMLSSIDFLDTVVDSRVKLPPVSYEDVALQGSSDAAIALDAVTEQAVDKIGAHRGNHFYLDVNGNGVWNGNAGGDRLIVFGNTDDVPLAGDWNGDGFDEVGVKRGNHFYLDVNGNGVWNGAAGGDRMLIFGNSTDKPIVGDWDIDGYDEIGTCRETTWEYYFYKDVNGNGVWDGPTGGDSRYDFNLKGEPLVGDWDGDGRDEFGVHRSGNHFIVRTLVYTEGFFFGATGDVPIIGDWNGDGVDEIGVKRGNQYLLDVSGNGQWNGVAGGDAQYVFGNPSDHPLDGNWNPADSSVAALASQMAPLTADAFAPTLHPALFVTADPYLTPSLLQGLNSMPVGILEGPMVPLDNAVSHAMLLDTQAAGHGRNMDRAPSDDSESASGLPSAKLDCELRMELLTSVLQESAFDHDDDLAAMLETLADFKSRNE